MDEAIKKRIKNLNIYFNENQLAIQGEIEALIRQKMRYEILNDLIEKIREVDFFYGPKELMGVIEEFSSISFKEVSHE